MIRTIRMPSTVVAAVAAAVLAMAASTVRAETPAEFYKGKSINLYVGVSPGGIYSTFALILAEHMAKHIPGHPNIVVQHMPGAGGTDRRGLCIRCGAEGWDRDTHAQCRRRTARVAGHR